jgi:hypothetical protein
MQRQATVSAATKLGRGFAVDRCFTPRLKWSVWAFVILAPGSLFVLALLWLAGQRKRWIGRTGGDQ